MVAGFRSIAEGRLDERPADLRLYGAMPRSAGLGTMMRALATRLTDGPEAATAVLDDADDAGPAGSADRTARLYEVYARLLVAIGTPAETRAAAAVNAEVAGDTLLAPVSGFAFGGATTLARGLTGDATALAELETAGAGRWLPSAWACVLRARHAASAADAAAELLRSADILDGLGRRLEAAERVIDAAEAHLDGCGTDRLEAALGIAREAGARWLIARAEALLPSGPAPRVVRDGDGPLTSREMDVVELVAEGLTNREIAGRLYISIRTVTSHLDHIYTKLGLSSRDALTDWRRRLEHARS
jgi:DNA-binding CsgD family transcriptional regulator